MMRVAATFMALGRGATESRASTSEPEPEDEDARTGVIADIAGNNELMNT
jgi:hypothetical protein